MISTQLLKLDTKYITKGDTLTEVFSFFDEDDNPIDLSIYNDIKMDIRRGLTTNSTILISVSMVGGEITITGTDNNILNIEIPSSVTINWDSNDYNRDIRFINDLEVTTLLYGAIKVRENITQL